MQKHHFFIKNLLKYEMKTKHKIGKYRKSVHNSGCHCSMYRNIMRETRKNAIIPA